MLPECIFGRVLYMNLIWLKYSNHQNAKPLGAILPPHALALPPRALTLPPLLANTPPHALTLPARILFDVIRNLNLCDSHEPRRSQIRLRLISDHPESQTPTRPRLSQPRRLRGAITSVGRWFPTSCSFLCVLL